MRSLRRHFLLPLAAALVCLLLQIANVPLYTGGSIGAAVGWRLEHGQLTLSVDSSIRHESFFVAFNSEPLRWGFDFATSGPAAFRLTLPIWPFTLGFLTLSLWLRRRSWRPVLGRCARCGYPTVASAAPCPECGKPPSGCNPSSTPASNVGP